MPKRRLVSPETEALYKSPQRRLDKARALVDKWPDIVKEEPGSDPSVTLYHFVTTTPSPNGFWTVTFREGSDKPLPPPPIPPAPGDPNPTDGGGSSTNSTAIYALYVRPDGSAAAGLPFGLTIGLGTRTVNGFLVFPYATTEEYSAGTISIVGPGTAVIETQEITDGLSLTDLQNQGKPYWLRHSKAYLLNGEPYTLFLFRRVGPAPAPVQYDSAITTWAYSEIDLPASPLSPLANGGEPTDLGIATIIQGSIGTPDPGTPGDPTPAPPPISPDPPSNPQSIACDCPDYSRVAYGVIDAVNPSAQRDREWVESEAGCETNYGCKHCMAVKLWRGLPVL